MTNMDKSRILKLAADKVYDTGYGPPERTLGKIAALWSTYLENDLNEYDVARMMILLKLGRDVGFSRKKDNYTDIAGYAELLACLFESDSEVL